MPWFLFQLAAALILQSLVNAQVCPQVNVRIANDQTCGSVRFQGSLQNRTCYQVDGGFSGVQIGHANDDRYNTHCVVFALLDPCSGRKTQDNVTGAEIAGGFLPYTGSGDYAPCTAVVKSSTRVPSWLTMICGDQTVSGCPTNTGNPSSSGTSVISTTTTSGPTSSPSKTTTGPTTTGPTTAAQANPAVTSAVNSASSKLASASAAVSSYYSNTTNAALASAAETALESAGISSSDAKNVANDFSASSVAQKLDNLFEQVFKAAALVILAEVALDSASALSVMEAVRAAGPLLSAAAAAAADPGQNPKPSTSRPTTSTTTTPAGPCTLCVECAEATLAKTTYTPPSLPSGVSKRSEISEIEASLADALQNVAYADEEFFMHILQKRSSQRYGQYCNFQVSVPAYSSWSSGGNNPYKPYYDHYTSTACGVWNWKLVSADTVAGLPRAPVNYDYADSGFETEHPYEIQQIGDFLEYARQNVPIFKSKYTSGQQFCDGFFRNQLNSTTQFGRAGLYDYNTKPINQIYNSLEGGTGGSTAEFVYLEEGVNGRKGSFFGRDTPSTSTFNRYLDALASSTQAVIVAQYMQQPLVVSIYKKVSSRIRTQFVNFGQACNDSTANQQWKDFGNIDWAGAYDAWESSYIDTISKNIATYASGAANTAYALIKTRLDQARLNQVALSEQDKFRFGQLLAQIRARQQSVLTTLSLSGLKR